MDLENNYLIAIKKWRYQCVEGLYFRRRKVSECGENFSVTAEGCWQNYRRITQVRDSRESYYFWEQCDIGL